MDLPNISTVSIFLLFIFSLSLLIHFEDSIFYWEKYVNNFEYDFELFYFFYYFFKFHSICIEAIKLIACQHFKIIPSPIIANYLSLSLVTFLSFKSIFYISIATPLLIILVCYGFKFCILLLHLFPPLVAMVLSDKVSSYLSPYFILFYLIEHFYLVKTLTSSASIYDLASCFLIVLSAFILLFYLFFFLLGYCVFVMC